MSCIAARRSRGRRTTKDSNMNACGNAAETTGECQRRRARDVLRREPRGRHEHQPVHARVERQRELGADEAAHRAPDHRHAVDPERVAHRVDGLGVALDRDRLDRHLRAAEPGQVDRQAATCVHERCEVEQEELPGVEHVDAPPQSSSGRCRACQSTSSQAASSPSA